MLNNIVLFRAIYSCTGDAQVTVNNAAIWTQAGQGTDSDVEREKANREAANQETANQETAKRGPQATRSHGHE